ncbi:hypothetical protein D0T60_00675 [Bacteroides sp. 224]|nr:hypothetical protein [Bacteroides sp. 224]
MTDEECSPLHVWSDGTQCVSCWKPSFIERLKILFTGKIWLGVVSGITQPPVYVSGESVFCKRKKKNVLRTIIWRLDWWLYELRWKLFRINRLKKILLWKYNKRLVISCRTMIHKKSKKD